MSVRTKKLHIKRKIKTGSSYKRKEESIPWRDVFKKEIKTYGEGSLALRGSRNKEDLSQKELADAIGISQHHISEMENGKRPIGKAMAKRLSEVLKVDYRIFL
jgi:ribosome-binding protein aMBF1 (putative translation factor)